MIRSAHLSLSRSIFFQHQRILHDEVFRDKLSSCKTQLHYDLIIFKASGYVNLIGLLIAKAPILICSGREKLIIGAFRVCLGVPEWNPSCQNPLKSDQALDPKREQFLQ